MDALSAVTLGIAVVGAILGLLNTWRSFNQDRVKLRVTPKISFPINSNGRDGYLSATGLTERNFSDYPPPQLSIEVLNLSNFAVTVEEIGVLYEGTKLRGVFLEPVLVKADRMPVRLEPRTSFRAYTEADMVQSLFAGFEVKCAYASTSCNVIKKGRSKSLMQLAEYWKKRIP